MANNVGTLITAEIRPQSEFDTIASAFANEIRGGWHNVSSIVERDSIYSDRKQDGMSCYVTDVSAAYVWNSSTGWTEFAGSSIAVDTSEFITHTEVSSISGDLQQQIDAIVIPDVSEFITSGEVASISGNLQQQIDAIVIPDVSEFITSSEVASISGDLQQQIDHKQNNITLVAGSNVSISESPTDTWTISASVSGYSGSSWIPIEGNGITITQVGDDYKFDVDTSGISGAGEFIPTIIDITGTSFSPDGSYDIYNYYLTGSATINAPTQMINGSSIIFKLQQPSVGAASLILLDNGGFIWKKPNGYISLSTDTGYAEDILTVLRIHNNLYVSIVKNF